MSATIPKWLDWVQRLEAISQDGLMYAENPFDIERYKQIRDISVQIAAEHTDASEPFIADLFTREIGYATPKIDSRAAVFRDGKILMVREKFDGLWTLPGGWIDVGESPGEAVAREVEEEAGYSVKAHKLIALLDRNKHNHPPNIWHIHKAFFLCDILGKAKKNTLETDGVDFFSEDDLPDLSTDRTTPEQITLCFRHYRNPDLPTDFD